MKLFIVMDEYSTIVNGLLKQSNFQCIFLFLFHHIPSIHCLFVLEFYNIILYND
jgi:hypothetical protein